MQSENFIGHKASLYMMNHMKLLFVHQKQLKIINYTRLYLMQISNTVHVKISDKNPS